jgi:site-specific recombinase XerD
MSYEDQSVAEHVTRYVHAQPEFSERTRRQYRELLLQAFGHWSQQGLDPLTLSAGDAADYFGELAAKLAARTYNLRLTVLRGFFDYLVEQKLRPDSPVDGLARLPEPDAPRDALTVRELRALLLAAEAPTDRAIVCLLGVNALGITDLVAARVTDFRPGQDPPRLRLSRQGSRTGETSLPPVSAEAVATCVEGRQRGALLLNRAGSPVNGANIRNAVTRVAADAGIGRRVIPAMLTHSLRYIAIEHGFTFRSLAKTFPDSSYAARSLIQAALRVDGPYRDEAPFRVAALIDHNVSTNIALLVQAERFLYADDVHPAAAAAMAGAVLERHLRDWAKLKESRVPGRPTLVSLTTALRNDRFISEQDVQFLHALAGDRDKAAHGRFAEVDHDLARSVLARVRDFMREHPL